MPTSSTNSNIEKKYENYDEKSMDNKISEKESSLLNEKSKGTTITTADKSAKEKWEDYQKMPFLISSGLLIVLALYVFHLMTKLILNGKSPSAILKTFGIPLIVVSAVLVSVTGIGTEDLSPIMGLLGTIAGYLLGRSSLKRESDNNSSNKTPETVPDPAKGS